MNLYTYQDALNHALDFLGGRGERDRNDALRAIQDAYREVASLRHWNFYAGQIRITTVASYSTGTVVYDHTGGANERMLTLTTGTWPTWAAFGTVVIANTRYEVERRISNSIVTLTEASNPGADVASTTYTLFRSTYSLPEGFRSLGEISSLGSASCWPEYVAPSDWILPQYMSQQPGTPRFYSLIGDPDLLDAMAIAFSPPPSTAIRFDGIYHRQPRRLLTPEYSTGRVTVTSGSTAITGTSTVFTSKMVGAVIRLSDAALHLPTSITGLHPAVQETTIQAFTNATTLVADSAFDSSATSVKYVISDPVDVETGTMLPMFLRCMEMNLARVRRMRDLKIITESFYQARRIAQEADARSSAAKYASAGMYQRYPGIRDLAVIGDDSE